MVAQWIFYTVPVAVAVAVASEAKPKKARVIPTVRGKGPPVRHADRRRDFSFSWYESGPSAEDTKHVGDISSGKYRVELYVLSPNIDGGVKFPSKFGKKFFGWNDPPPDGAPVIEAGVKVSNTALALAGPVIEAGAQSLGVPPGVASSITEAVKKIFEAIPKGLKKSRVLVWSRWREGKYGSSSDRETVIEQVRVWRDLNPRVSMKRSHQLLYYSWEGLTGEIPETERDIPGGKPISPSSAFVYDGRPTAFLEPLGDGSSHRVKVRLPSTLKAGNGERRMVIFVTPVKD